MSKFKKRFLKYVGEDGRLEIHVSSLTKDDIQFILKNGVIESSINKFRPSCKSVDIWEDRGLLYYAFFSSEYTANDWKLFKQIRNGKLKEKLK